MTVSVVDVDGLVSEKLKTLSIMPIVIVSGIEDNVCLLAIEGAFMVQKGRVRVSMLRTVLRIRGACVKVDHTN